MSAKIHPTAIIEDGASIGDDVSIGAFCHIGKDVKLGNESLLHSHVVLAGHTKIGARAKIFPFASIGHEPQDLKFAGEASTLDVGDDCVIREGVTMNPGTAGDINRTVVGNKCVFLTSSHVAHDCIVGDNTIFSNNVMLAGHCNIGSNVILGGGAGIHQFCRIGNNAFVGGLAALENDVIPFGIALGNRAYLGGLNLIGMKRAGIDRQSIHNARNALKFLFSSNIPVMEAVDQLDEELANDPVVKQIADFIRQSGNRSLCIPKAKGMDS
ncbi:MAG: acyl-ACP--UDP-N-acetylglucosamine O-acyltransferase [Rhizobiaceae bacterium]|nr:acyl-ACP--UDP-N-acetylglucosamine O-acyltransferase [Rhizobiaceae bacterium]MBL4695312.1 acyl-ACP--UDP-N-acetylglucosamine O-acyltransferase [Rhizobiaceae bacterium]MBL4733713.1 acyl-ACP--UDP-N-acetylglucosamine O-acyltransferase [Rhizobiaceae bacterium]